jgi:hypothetical protein
VTADFSACDPDQPPIWLAAQDGNGAWTMLTGTNHVYQYTLNSATGAYAYVTGRVGSYQVNVQYGSKSDLTGNTIVFCAVPTSGTNTVTGTVAALGATGIASFGYGGVFAEAFSFAPTVTFNLVPDGTWDLVGYRQSAGAVSGTDRAYAQRGVVASNGRPARRRHAAPSLLTGATYTLAMPDLSGATGWNNSWAPPPGQTSEWNPDATSTSAITGNRCVEGATIRTTQLSGTK